ncbi:hypothetical protein CK203_087179 [Vitis vinifera]|uniref:Uncharacterized protein n=1 Tax=Vitis vinifera TaxID=29760 RepID=A0A438BRU8_VITVI|nr:hypothetical protein CK203_087179 [Vitis vinifera]
MDFYQSMTTKQHWTQRRGVLLEAYSRFLRDISWPSPPNYGCPSLFEEKVHKKKLQRADAIPLLFPGCCARFWSIWGIHQILSWSANAFAERAALLRRWQHSSMPRADVGHPGSAHCHLKAAPASFDLPSALSLHLPHCATLHPQSLRPLLKQLLKRQTICLSLQHHHHLINIYLYIPYEVPLPPFNCNHPYHIEDNAQFVGGGEK